MKHLPFRLPLVLVDGPDGDVWVRDDDGRAVIERTHGFTAYEHRKVCEWVVEQANKDYKVVRYKTARKKP